MSRSTDRNLDELGLDDDDPLFITASGIPVRHSDVDVLSLLTREPPDGKEKPEPAGKSSLHKLEASSGVPSSLAAIMPPPTPLSMSSMQIATTTALSRKSSKCEFQFPSSAAASTMSSSGNGSLSTSGIGVSSASQQAQMDMSSNNNRSSEAHSLCGDTSSVLSGSSSGIMASSGLGSSSGMGLPPTSSAVSKAADNPLLTSAGTLASVPPTSLACAPSSILSSTSSSGNAVKSLAANKDQIPPPSSLMFSVPSSGGPSHAMEQHQLLPPQPRQDADEPDILGGSIVSSSKDW